MGWYPKAIRKNIPPGPNDPKVKPTAIVKHVAASEGPSLYPYFNGPSGGVESHIYIRYTGVVEQYRDTDYQADAQMGDARNQISVETEGLADGRWTPEQIAALIDFDLWAAQEHGIPLVLNTSETNPVGIAWHSQFRSWTGDGRTCPGVNRIPQIRNQILPALQGDDMPLTPDDIKAVAKASGDEVWTRPVDDGQGGRPTTGAAIGYSLRNSIAAVRALEALAQNLPAEAAKAVLDALNGTYEAKVELTPKEQ